MGGQGEGLRQKKNPKGRGKEEWCERKNVSRANQNIAAFVETYGNLIQ